MSSLDKVPVAISVVLGRAEFSIRELLSFGRGARLPLEGADGVAVTICANGLPVARGRLSSSEDGRLIVTFDALETPKAAESALAA